MNTRLLRRVQKHILAKPQRLYMSEGLVIGEPGTIPEVSSDYGEPAPKIPECGTAGCIAGWAFIIGTGIKVPKETSWGHVSERAQSLLGLHVPSINTFTRLSELAERLFRVERWPKSFNAKYLNAKTQTARAKIAGQRIDHFIATKGAE